jgi:hypothetical protein
VATRADRHGFARSAVAGLHAVIRFCEQQLHTADSQLRLLSGAIFGRASAGVLDLRHLSADPLAASRCAGARPFLIDTPLAMVRTFGALAFACTMDGGSPFIEAMIAYGKGECTSYAESALRRFYETWQPRNLAEAFAIDLSAASPLLIAYPPILFITPWAGSDSMRLADRAIASLPRKSRRLGGKWAISRFSGPVSDAYGEMRFANLVRVYESMRSRDTDSQPPARANLLIRDGEARLLIADGNHRVSAAVALGRDRAPIIIESSGKYGPAVIRREEAANWPGVRSGMFSESQALDIFDRIFDARRPASCGWPPRH